MRKAIETFLRRKSLYSYAWETVGGDDPQKRMPDAARVNRAEGYEVLEIVADVLRRMKWKGTDARIADVEFEVHASDAAERETLIQEMIAALELEEEV